MAPLFTIRAVEPEDRPWVAAFLREHAGSERQVSRGHVHEVDKLPAFAAFSGEHTIALAAYVIRGAECELAALFAAERYRGAGTVLLDAVAEAAREAGCTRLWLITTNDNVDALRFYQRRGFRLVAVHVGAVDEWRRTLKPEIPERGNHGIPIRDEIELELDL